MRKINGFNKGVNFGGWLSQCSYEKLHLDTFITENGALTMSVFHLTIILSKTTTALSSMTASYTLIWL